MNEEKQQNQNRLISLITLGESSVGKTSLICKYVDNSFENSVISTVGIDFKIKKINKFGTNINLKIWDTAGQEKFNTIQNQFYKNINGILLIFDVTNNSSFDNLYKWYEKIQNESPENCIIVLIGNKIDLIDEIQISDEKAINFAQEHSIKFFPISCKYGYNVNEVFDYIIFEILKNQKDEKKNIIIEKKILLDSKKHIKCCK